jgi:hypothetical protein
MGSWTSLDRFKSFSPSDFKALLHSDEGKFARIHSWIMLTES